jgi:hypothetical protein
MRLQPAEINTKQVSRKKKVATTTKFFVTLGAPMVELLINEHIVINLVIFWDATIDAKETI